MQLAVMSSWQLAIMRRNYSLLLSPSVEKEKKGKMKNKGMGEGGGGGAPGEHVLHSLPRATCLISLSPGSAHLISLPPQPSIRFHNYQRERKESWQLHLFSEVGWQLYRVQNEGVRGKKS